MWVSCRTGLPGTFVPGVHRNCIHNEIAALRMRSLAPLPAGIEPELSLDLVGVVIRLRTIARRYRGVAWDHLRTAGSYDGAMRRRYLEAARSLSEDGPVDGRDAHLSAFLKAEKLGPAKDEKPRMIFPRSPRFNLALASYLKPFEHWLWGFLTARRLFGGSNTRVVGKGLGPFARANLIRRKMGEFADCRVFEVDAKAFEAHVVQSLCDLERSVYRSAYPAARELSRLLSMQKFSGVTSGGVKFSRPGGRASGDFNTGMGNSILMLCVVICVLERFGCQFDVLCDGDNCLVFLESRDMDRVWSGFYDAALHCSGFEMELDRPVSVLEHVRFGRSAPVFVDGRWTMMRDPRRVLSGLASHRWLREPAFARRWVNGVARCELSLCRGAPVLQAFALSVIDQTRSAKAVPLFALVDWFQLGARVVDSDFAAEVGDEARVSFARAFGIEPDEQRRWEAALANCHVGHPGGVIDMAPPSNWQSAHPGLYEAYLGLTSV